MSVRRELDALLEAAELFHDPADVSLISHVRASLAAFDEAERQRTRWSWRQGDAAIPVTAEEDEAMEEVARAAKQATCAKSQTDPECLSAQPAAPTSADDGYPWLKALRKATAVVEASAAAPTSAQQARRMLDRMARGYSSSYTTNQNFTARPEEAAAPTSGTGDAKQPWKAGQVRLIKRPGEDAFSAPMTLLLSANGAWASADATGKEFLAMDSWESVLLAEAPAQPGPQRDGADASAGTMDDPDDKCSGPFETRCAICRMFYYEAAAATWKAVAKRYRCQLSVSDALVTAFRSARNLAMTNAQSQGERLDRLKLELENTQANAATTQRERDELEQDRDKWLNQCCEQKAELERLRRAAPDVTAELEQARADLEFYRRERDERIVAGNTNADVTAAVEAERARCRDWAWAFRAGEMNSVGELVHVITSGEAAPVRYASASPAQPATAVKDWPEWKRRGSGVLRELAQPATVGERKLAAGWVRGFFGKCVFQATATSGRCADEATFHGHYKGRETQLCEKHAQMHHVGAFATPEAAPTATTEAPTGEPNPLARCKCGHAVGFHEGGVECAFYPICPCKAFEPIATPPAEPPRCREWCGRPGSNDDLHAGWFRTNAWFCALECWAAGRSLRPVIKGTP